MRTDADKKWNYAVGMIQVDGLEPSSEFLEWVEKEKKGEMTMADMRRALDKKYKTKEQENIYE